MENLNSGLGVITYLLVHVGNIETLGDIIQKRVNSDFIATQFYTNIRISRIGSFAAFYFDREWKRSTYISSTYF